ncbi:1702_t:CDS:2, partial [Ambispora leptoticha]
LPEPKSFYPLRIFTAVLILITYTGYCIFLIWQISRDSPVLRDFQEFEDLLPVPDIQICGWQNDIQIERCDFLWNNSTVTTYENCTGPIQKLYQSPNRINLNDFCYLFTIVDKTIKYGRLDNDTLKNIDFYYKILNMTSFSEYSISVATIAIQLYDPSFNPVWDGTQLRGMVDDAMNQNFKLEFNTFAGIYNYSSLAKIQRSVFRSILPGDISAIFGFNPSYHNTTTYSVNPEYFPLHLSQNITDEEYSGHFSVKVGTFSQDVREQQRTHTILGALGLAGGGFGALCGIYVALFGEARLRPWGWMHHAAKASISQKLRALDPTNIPFVTSLVVTGRNINPVEERTRRLEERIDELEGILSDYFLDGRFLAKLQTRRAATMTSILADSTMDKANNEVVSDKVVGDDETRANIE